MTSAELKWLELFVDIVNYELQHAHDDQLLTNACHRWVDSRPIAARAFIVSAGALLTLHLAKLVDPRFDLISRSFWRRDRLRCKRIR